MARLAIPPVGCSEPDYRAVVMAANLVWQANQIKPSVTSIQRITTSLTPEKIREILSSEEFTAAMIAAGIPWNDQVDALSTRQMMAIQVMANPLSGRTTSQRLKQAGVTSREWQTWKKNPVFREQWERLSYELILEHKGELIAEVLRLSLDGKLEAIKYAHELSGEFSPVDQKLQDMQTFVQTILEIIQTEVKDEETLGRISTRVMAAMNPNPSPPKLKELIINGYIDD